MKQTIRTRDGRVFKSRSNKREVAPSGSKAEVTSPPVRKSDKYVGELERLCAVHADGVSDLFQQKPRRLPRWDPLRDRERARKIRLLQLPDLKDEGEQQGDEEGDE